MPRTLITPRDLLVAADAPVQLEVEIERGLWPFFDPPLAREEIEVGGRKALTDPEGEARVELGPLGPGFHRLPIRHAGATAEAWVAVVAREAPIFITDIDHTIADISSFGFIFKKVGEVPPLPGALEALERIASRMQLVYLSARDHIFTRKTKEWLALQRFPPAPVYLRRRTRFWTVRSRDHKISRLRELKLMFPNVRWGVGDLPGDAQAYHAQGIPPIVISRRPSRGLPDGTIQVSSWSEISRLVAP